MKALISVCREPYGGILDLQINAQLGKDIVYIGLDQGGVYEVSFCAKQIGFVEMDHRVKEEISLPYGKLREVW
jgi:hypothetical protein